MDKSLVKFEKPDLPEIWSYKDSISKVKQVIYKWGRMTQELLEELWIAREKLSEHGGDRRSDQRNKSFIETWSGYCEEIGSSRQVVNRWLAAFEVGWQNLLLSQNPEWFTPKEYVKSVHEVLGQIDLDPASCEDANRTIMAEKYYSKEENGLFQAWTGKIFLNPPYGNEGPPFIQKLIEEFKNGNITEAILLVNSRATDAEWFQPLYDHVICFTNHRIDFDSLDEKKNSSTHGSCFIYFGPNKKKFAEVFSGFGAVLKRFNGEHSG